MLNIQQWINDYAINNPFNQDENADLQLLMMHTTEFVWFRNSLIASDDVIEQNRCRNYRYCMRANHCWLPQKEMIIWSNDVSFLLNLNKPLKRIVLSLYISVCRHYQLIHYGKNSRMYAVDNAKRLFNNYMFFLSYFDFNWHNKSTLAIVVSVCYEYQSLSGTPYWGTAYKGKEQVTSSHSICGMYLLVLGLDTCFWHNTPHMSQDHNDLALYGPMAISGHKAMNSL